MGGTRRLNRHYQGSGDGEKVRIIYRERDLQPTYPAQSTEYQQAIGDEIFFRTKLSGYVFSRLTGSVAPQDGWVWEAKATVTAAGRPYPFNMTPETCRAARDRFSRPYRYGERIAASAIYPKLIANKIGYTACKIWGLAFNCEYYEDGRQRRNGIQPVKATITNAARQFTDILYFKEIEGDPWAYEVLFGDPSDPDYNTNTEKIAAMFQAIGRIRATGNRVPIWNYDTTTGEFSERTPTGGLDPGSVGTGGQIGFMISTGDLTLERGLDTTILQSGFLLPTLEGTI